MGRLLPYFVSAVVFLTTWLIPGAGGAWEGGNRTSESSTLQEAFDLSGATLGQLVAQGYYTDLPSGMSALTLVETAIGLLPIAGDGGSWQVTPEGAAVAGAGLLATGERAVVLAGPQAGSRGMRLAIMLQGPGKANLHQLEGYLLAAATSLGARVSFAYLLQGELQGRRSIPEAEALAARVLARLAVKEATMVTSPGLVSWSGRSPLLTNVLTATDLSQLNVNLAIRYRGDRDVTLVLLGSPVLPGEY